jgi:hypothetical protein
MAAFTHAACGSGMDEQIAIGCKARPEQWFGTDHPDAIKAAIPLLSTDPSDLTDVPAKTYQQGQYTTDKSCTASARTNLRPLQHTSIPVPRQAKDNTRHTLSPTRFSADAPRQWPAQHAELELQAGIGKAENFAQAALS